MEETLKRLKNHVDALGGLNCAVELKSGMILHRSTQLSSVLSLGDEAIVNLKEILPPDDAHEVLAVLRSQGLLHKECTAFGGSERNVTLSGFRVDDICGFIQFQYSEETKLPVWSTANALILSCDRNGVLLTHNHAAELFFRNHGMHDILGTPIISCFDTISRHSVQKLVGVSMTGKEYYHTEAYLAHDTQRQQRLLVQSAPFPNSNQGVMLVIHVLDDQLESALRRQQARAHLAEELNEILKLEIEEHQLTQKKLLDAERYANSIIDSSIDLILSTDKSMTVTEFNRTAERVTGYKRKVMVGKSLESIMPDIARRDQILKTIDATGSWEGKLGINASTGANLRVQLSMTTLRNAGGEGMGYMISMRDITEAEEAEQLASEQQAKIEAIFNSGSIMFWTVNRNTALTSFNREYGEAIYRLYGEYPSINKDLKKPKRTFASEEYHKFWFVKYMEVFDSEKRVYFQTKTKDLSGQIIYREIYLSPIYDNTGTGVKEIAGMAIDISDKKEAERRMSEQSAKIQAIFNASNHMIWSVDTAYNFTFFNENFVKRMLERYGHEPLLGENAIHFADRCNPGNGANWTTCYLKVFKGEKHQFDELVVDMNGKEHLEEVSLNPILNDERQVVEIAAISQTVTFKRSAERKLKDQAAKINAIFDSTAMLIWTVDVNLRIVAYNRIFAQQHFKLLGKEVSIGSRFPDGLVNAIGENSRNDLDKYFEKAFAGEQQQFEGVLYDTEGGKHWMETFFNPIYFETGEIREISCLSYEITDKKIIQQQMLESIQEKEVLLQEVHHRVKNNLQVISSILNLQSSYVKDENSLNILRESQNRIKSMSFIHESLYHTRDFSRIEFSDYILSLTSSLIHSYSITTGMIKLHTDFDKLYLSLDQAIPCGLIVNELISNALKYAFPNRNTGDIEMKMKEVDNRIELYIGDNGVGLPENFDVENSDSLGLQLVYTLADQLDAQISCSSGKGTNYLITFEKQ